jgi:hypothetical protein
VEPGSILDNPEEFGRTIAAAVSYADESLLDFATKIGLTEPTLRSYIDGNLGRYAGSRELRTVLARKVVEASGCPDYWFSLSEPEPGEVARLRDALERVQSDLAQEVSGLSSDLTDQQKAQEDLRSRVERLERGEEGTGT